MSIEVLECEVGIIGIIIGDFYDCYWQSYDLEPLMQFHFLNSLDKSVEIIPWSCNFDQGIDPKADEEDSNNRGYGDEYFATDYY
jgi:hypothetical protein